METITISNLGSMKYTTQNDLHWKYQSKRVVILIEIKFIKCVSVPSMPPDEGTMFRWCVAGILKTRDSEAAAEETLFCTCVAGFRKT